MESLASQAKPAAVLWLAGFLQAARLHRVVSFCVSSRALSIRIAQCFLLNGFIFLGSLLTLKSVVIPTLLWILPEQCDQSWGQHLCDHTAAVAMYSFLRSGLVEIFYVFWFYPLYIFSFIISTLWYGPLFYYPQDKHVSDAKQGNTDYLFVILTILRQVTVIGYVPYLGKAMNFLLLSLMYAYYCFEYKWNFFAVSLNHRLDFFESNWAFFAGFGSPCVLPIFFFSPLTSYGVMAILYPLFVMTAAGTQEEQVIDELKPSHGGKLNRIPLFFVAKRLTTQALQLFPEAQKEQ